MVADGLPPLTEAEERNAAAIEIVRAELRGALCDASSGLRRANSAIKRLCDALYDIEYAESGDGEDIARHLDIADLHLRAAWRATVEPDGE